MSLEELLVAFGSAIIAGLIKEIPTEAPRIPALVAQIAADFKTTHPQFGAPPPDPEQPAIDAEIDADLAKLPS